ncbi:MAG: Ni/Fe hydrogenase subunit alpha [Vicinamibacterales bacterium]
MTSPHAHTAPGYRRISIDPITRLEGHGKIDIFLDEAGEVAECFFQVPELRGFEKFCEGRPVEELPRITPRICGVCPEAHMMASAKACDAVYNVSLPPTARMLRELQYCIFFVTDHATHFYALAAPDFVMGPASDPASRNLIGVIRKLGVEIGGQVIKARQWGHEAASIFGGRPVIPINAIPGGMSKPISAEERTRLEEIASFMVEFSSFTLKILDEVVLENQAYVDLILNGPYHHRTHSMGLVDQKNRVNFYDGMVRVVDPDGLEVCKFQPAHYARHIAEHVEPWSYLKFPYLRDVGWKGFVDGTSSGVYRATPQSRLNASDGMSTPRAQEAYERYYETLTGDRSGRKPVHHTLAIHWARVIEMMNAAERALELVRHPDITNPEKYRVVPTETPTEGVGIVEAPRGTLTHHYVTDERGIVRKANLIVGTTNNHAAICMSIKKAAQGLIRRGEPVTEGVLNQIEMAFRAYDPCFGCATHSLPGRMPLVVRLREKDGTVVGETMR